MNRANPQNEARLGGALYLAVIVTAFFAELFVRSSLIVSNNPVETAPICRSRSGSTGSPEWRISSTSFATSASRSSFMIC